MTSFNYGGNKAKEVDLTSRCHLSNIMPDSIFYDSMAWGMTQFFLFVFFFLRAGNRYLPQHKRNGFSLITITPVGRGETLTYNGIRQMGSIIFQ